MRYIIYTDGAARGNPGPSASGYLVYSNRRVINRQSVYNGEATNNYAEYRAIILALEWCRDNLDVKETEIKVYSDSQLVIRQINGHYKVKSERLFEMNRKAKALAAKFSGMVFEDVGRENKGISAVDRQLNALLDKIATDAGKV